ncbi:MAG: hypothetical protein Q9162_004207 [Coniocarpon cinnabarinum]
MSYQSYQDESHEPDDPLERDPTARQQTPYHDDVESGPNVSTTGFGNMEERAVDPYSTSLPMRLEVEAALAYLGLPPAGGAILLMLEHKSDYVRFHAWQSSLLFTALFGLHLIFSFTAVVSYILLVVDLVLIAFLTWHAYNDADSLGRFELPWFGTLANNFVDAE